MAETEDEVDPDLPTFVAANQPCSMAAARFHKRHFDIFDFLLFATHLAHRTDEGRLRAARALANGGSVADQEQLARVELAKDATITKLRSYQDLISENMVIRLVDNFVCYISEVLQNCLITRPEMLSSKGMIAVEDVLRFSSHSELVAYIVDSKLNELTYGGMDKIEEFLSKRTGVAITTSEKEKRQLSFAIELRNIYTHNRGIVNDIIIRRLERQKHDFKLDKGVRYHADLSQICALANNMHALASRADAELVRKFALPVKAYSDW